MDSNKTTLGTGGTLYNEQLDKNPEQVRQEVLRDGEL